MRLWSVHWDWVCEHLTSCRLVSYVYIVKHSQRYLNRIYYADEMCVRHLCAVARKRAMWLRSPTFLQVSTPLFTSILIPTHLIPTGVSSLVFGPPPKLYIISRSSSSKSGTTGPDCTIFPHISIAAQHAPRFRLSQQRFALSSKHERHLYFACEARAVYSFVCGSCFGHGFLC